MPSLRIKTTAFSKPRFHQSSQRDVHVVTAEKQVVTDRDPLELELGLAFSHHNQTHVGSAAAYVTHQNQTACVQMRLPGIRMRGQPGVKPGLRLFEQRYLW